MAIASVFAGPEIAVRAERVGDGPIITEGMLPGELGASINGPSLIRVPPWIAHPLGRYYLYFAHHAGKYLRLAYADEIAGPWKIYAGEVQPLSEQTAVAGHVASPEVIVDASTHQLFLFYHGNNLRKNDPTAAFDDDGGSGGNQITSVAVSSDGLHFQSRNVVVGPAYLRVFTHGGQWFALSDSGWLRRAEQLGGPFRKVTKVIGDDITAAVDPARRGEPGAPLADRRPKTGPDRYAIRHVGIDVMAERLVIYFSCVGHRPERILCTSVDLTGAPETWRAKGVAEVLRPEKPWEGADRPLAYSKGGISRTHVNELRDPAVFREDGRAWLLYSVAGEHGLGLARLDYGELAKMP